MSTEENERLTNGTVLQTKAKGVLPIDNMVSNTIPPSERHLTPSVTMVLLAKQFSPTAANLILLLIRRQNIKILRPICHTKM